MRDVQVLIKLIIPILIGIFWVLSYLFDRENAANKSKGISSGGPRPGGFPPTRPSEKDRLSGSPAMAPRYVPPGKDEILIIRSETNRPASRPANPPPRRNPGRGRNGSAPPPRRVEPVAPSMNRDIVGGKIVTDVNQSLSSTIDGRSLTQSMAAASAATSIGTQSAASVVAEGVQPSMSSLDLRATMTDPLRIREAFLLNEMLQPPVSMRKGRGRRL